VVGKGIAAALLVAAIRASLFSLVELELALRAILRRANHFVHQSVEEGKFVTLFYGVMDVRAQRLIYVNAGHLPPVLLRSTGELELLEEGGVPLGLFPDPRYYEGFARLGAGDLLALYTDGVTEAENASGEPYGREGLVRTLAVTRHRSAKGICRAVLDDTRRFGGNRIVDDQTLVVLKAT
jgi:sigma-B regulation protein RsbU (phosphoserine phosphatase)